MIKVSELLELLENEDPETFVVVASDPEGNDYHVLDEGLAHSYFQIRSRGRIEVDDEYEGANACTCIVLSPGYSRELD